MGNLLTAGLRRMVKSRAFLLALLAELAYTALAVLVCWDHYAANTGSYTIESVLTAGFGLMGYLSVPSLIAAPLLCVHLGTEYSENTLRNKLIVGHTRPAVYLADLLSCAIAALGLDLLYMLLAGALCVYPVLGMTGRLLTASPGQLLAWIAVGLLARAAWASVVTLTATVLGSRTSAAVAGLLLAVGASLVCSFGFHELEYLSRHLDAANREVRLALWQLALDTLPTGQYLQVSRLDTPNLWRLPLLSLAVAAGSTGIGAALFQRKDLR